MARSNPRHKTNLKAKLLKLISTDALHLIWLAMSYSAKKIGCKGLSPHRCNETFCKRFTDANLQKEKTVLETADSVGLNANLAMLFLSFYLQNFVKTLHCFPYNSHWCATFCLGQSHKISKKNFDVWDSEKFEACEYFCEAWSISLVASWLLHDEALWVWFRPTV